MEEPKPHYHKGIGVLAGLILSGSAHFFSGNRSAGLKWYLCIPCLSTCGIFIAAIPGIFSYALGLTLILSTFLLWVAMLKQSCRPIRRIGILGWITIILINLITNTIQFNALYACIRPYRVPTSGMSPTIQGGDQIIGERLSYMWRDPHRGEIVIFKTENIPGITNGGLFVQRVVGLPGETIRIDPPNLIIDGEIIKDPGIINIITSQTDGYKGFNLAGSTYGLRPLLLNADDEISLGEDQYFVLGDNTTDSLDSRYWGTVRRENIVSRATRIHWPIRRISQSLSPNP